MRCPAAPWQALARTVACRAGAVGPRRAVGVPGCWRAPTGAPGAHGGRSGGDRGRERSGITGPRDAAPSPAAHQHRWCIRPHQVRGIASSRAHDRSPSGWIPPGTIRRYAAVFAVSEDGPGRRDTRSHPSRRIPGAGSFFSSPCAAPSLWYERATRSGISSPTPLSVRRGPGNARQQPGTPTARRGPTAPARQATVRARACHGAAGQRIRCLPESDTHRDPRIPGQGKTDVPVCRRR